MSKKTKLLERLRSKPRDFTFDEAQTLLGMCGFNRGKTGKTGGSRVRFERNGVIFNMHKPHPRNELPQYVVIDLVNKLKGER